MISSSDFAGVRFFRTILIFGVVDPIFHIRLKGRLAYIAGVCWVSSPDFIVRSGYSWVADFKLWCVEDLDWRLRIW